MKKWCRILAEQTDRMLKLGMVLTAATVTILAVEFFRAQRKPFPAHGWLGLVALACAEFLMFHGIEPAATYFSPVAWTAYILVADAAIFAISGHSRLREEPRGLLKMAALSIPLWLIFEAYNLRLANWAYVGLPQGRLERWIGYGWAFATITPGIFMTAALIESFGWFKQESRPLRFNRATQTAFIVLGAVMLIAPLLVPRITAAYLFGLVWLGFLFLLEPDQAEQIRSGDPWDKQRRDEHHGTEYDERRLRRAVETQRAGFLFEPAEGLDQRGGHENPGRDRCEGPAVADPSFEATLRQSDICPVREPQIVRFKNQPQRN